jgi:hypothetical protein
MVELPNGHIVEVNKAAPMGSAMCFPLQCIVFSTVLSLALSLTRQGINFEKYMSDGIPVAKGCPVDRNSRVYGDDIITRYDQTELVISLLSALGFKVNSSKSFFGDRVFRESCGVFAIEGKDVSPLMFKVKGLIDGSPKRIPALVDFANRCFQKGFWVLRDYIIGLIPKICRVFVPPDSPHLGGSGGHVVGYESNDYFSVRKGRKKPFYEKRWNSSLCRMEYKIDVVGVPVKQIDNDQSSRYQYAKWAHVLPVERDPYSPCGVNPLSDYQSKISLNLGTDGKVRKNKPPIGDPGKPGLHRVWVAV